MNRNVFNIQTCANFTISILLSLGLVACGGGSGGSSETNPPATSTTPVAITATNAPTVASTTINSPANAMGSSGYSSSPLAVNTVAPRTLSRLTLDAKQQTLAVLSKPQFSATLVQTTNCAISGSKTVDTPIGGTSVAVTFNNCSDTAGEAMNGTMLLTNITSSATSFSATSSVDLVVATTGNRLSV